MKRTVLLLVLASSLAVSGCGGSGGAGISAAALQLAECTGLGLQELTAIVEGVFDLIDAIDDPGNPPAGVTYTAATGAFTVEIDFDGDDVTDATITGVVMSQSDIMDGFDTGEIIDIDWSLATGNVTGGGMFTIRRIAANLFAFDSGFGSLTSPGSCTFDITSVDMTIGTGNPLGLDAAGILGFESMTGEMLVGTIDFAGIDFDAFVSGTYMGSTVFFSIDLDTFQPYDFFDSL